MSFETLAVPRARFSVEDPWTAPADCEPVRLRSATNGEVPRLATSVAVWHDGECLSILFSGADDRIVATYLEHDQPLWEEDVVEVFLAPERITEYYELEVNPKGTTFDARIESPAGERSSMRTDLGWTCEGLVAAVRTVVESSGAITFDVLVRFPFASVGRAPLPGEIWRANFFRIDRHPLGDEFSAWQPTMKQPADFHVPAVFGTLRFG
ncbi:MAG TPA: carbohydrate-binding family 9-like protein [Thermoanaerobaculia bacterium]|jgi:hypothetical protein